MFIIIEGNPIDGFIFTGPFATVEEAEYAVRNGGDNWHIARLAAPLDSTEDAETADSKPMTVLDLIVKAEQDGLVDETQYGAYIWTLVSSGLVNSTGSNQRAVASYADAYGDDWQNIALESFKSVFHGATTVQEAGL